MEKFNGSHNSYIGWLYEHIHVIIAAWLACISYLRVYLVQNVSFRFQHRHRQTVTFSGTFIFFFFAGNVECSSVFLFLILLPCGSVPRTWWSGRSVSLSIRYMLYLLDELCLLAECNIAKLVSHI